MKLTKFIPEIKIQPIRPVDNEQLLKYFEQNKKEILDTILSTTTQQFYRNNQLYLVNRWISQPAFISTIKYVGAVEITDHLNIHYLYLSLTPLEHGHYGNKMTNNIKFKGITIYYSF
jgi:hypothetical protein